MQFRRIVCFVGLGCLSAFHAHAQSSWSNVPLIYPGSISPPPPPNASPNDLVVVNAGNIGAGIQLQNFASQQDLANALTQMGNTLTQMNNTAAQINAAISSSESRAAQGVAMAAAMTVLPPNPGDRFSLTFSGAGFNSEGAGSVTGTYRIADRVLLFAGYARSSSMNLGKAGVSFSFQ